MSAGIATASIAASMSPVPSPASVNLVSSWQETTAHVLVSEFSVLQQLMNNLFAISPGLVIFEELCHVLRSNPGVVKPFDKWAAIAFKIWQRGQTSISWSVLVIKVIYLSKKRRVIQAAG